MLVWHGSLWHGGGANTTATRRVGIAMNYCAGYIRQQENQQLGLPLDTVRRFPPRLQQLVGYGIYRGLIGHIDKQVPANLLLEGSEDSPWCGTTGRLTPDVLVRSPTGTDRTAPARGRSDRLPLEAAGGIEPPYGALQASIWRPQTCADQDSDAYGHPRDNGMCHGCAMDRP